MAARPVPHSLAVLSLAFGIAAVGAPAMAQNYIGGGYIQINPQALDQLGGSRMVAPPATQTPLIGATGNGKAGNAKTVRQPRPAPLAALQQPTGPQPLLGETGKPASTAAIKLRPPGSSTATRKASASAPAKATPAPAVAAAPATPTAASAPAPTAPAAPAAIPAPVAGAPLPVTPAQPAAQATVQPPAAPPTPAPAAPAPSTVQAPTTASAAPAPTPAPAPAPVPAPVPAPAAAPTPQAAAPVPAAPAPQVAAAPVAPRPVPAPAAQGGVVTIAFPGGQGELPPGDLTALDALAKQYAAGEDRLQIRAYATNSVSDGGSGARRLSLTRALAVRQYLIDKGIRSTRIDVRALGAPTDGSAPDRVEIAPVGR